MKSLTRTGVAIILIVVTGLVTLTSQSIAQTSGDSGLAAGPALFAGDTTIYFQIARGGELMDKVLSHPLRAKIEQLDQVKEAMASPGFLQMRAGVGLMEAQLGTDWQTAIRKLSAHGLHAGFRASDQSFCLALHSDDEELLKKTAGTMLSFIRNNAGEGASPFELTDHRGGKMARFREGSIARMGRWFLASNNHNALVELADRVAERETAKNADGSSGGKSLLQNAEFRKAWDGRDQDSDAFAFVDVGAFRKAGLAPELFSGKTNNPGAELLVGGVLEGLSKANYLSASLKFDASKLLTSIRLPHVAADSTAVREFFFGNQGMGRAPVPLEMEGLAAQVVTYRNLGAWWLAKEDLFPEEVVAQLAQGDSQLSTLFGGVDFGADVLGAVHPEMRLLVRAQKYPEGVNPDVKIPAFALVTRLQNPSSERRFRISFQSLVGILNLSDDGMDRPQIELVSGKEDGIQITGGQYTPESGFSGEMIVFNFSPAMAFVDDYMVISSTLDFAREVAETVRDQDDNTRSGESNTLIDLQAAAVRELLDMNREALIANMMVEQGIDHEKAADRFGILLDLLAYAGSLTVDYRIESESMVLDTCLNFAEPAAR
jgi:hypothetical protein